MNLTSYYPFAFVQGEFKPFEDATISIATHALHYGTAAFGGLRIAVDSANPNEVLLFRINDHVKRLSQSAYFLQYNISPEQLKSHIIKFIQINKIRESGYIRPLVYVSDLGISPRIHELQKDVLIYGFPFGDYFQGDLKVCFSSWQRQADASFPLRGKISGGYITSSLAKSEAIERGFDDAIMMNTQGKVSEGTGMNIFIVRDGVLITPSVDQDILEGITRRSIITIAENLGYTIVQRPVDKSELLIADEVFLCGTAAKLTCVSQIENYVLPKQHPIADTIKQALSLIVSGHDNNYSHWIERVAIDV